MMASMGFSQTTITDLLGLVDENKSNMSEDTYIRMCNLLRHVHLLEQQTTTTSNIIVPEPFLQNIEKIKLDFRYKFYVLNNGVVTSHDKLNVLNRLFNKPNITFTRNYEASALLYISSQELDKLYDEERKHRCRNDPIYKKIIDDYTSILNIRPQLCFCE